MGLCMTLRSLSFRLNKGKFKYTSIEVFTYSDKSGNGTKGLYKNTLSLDNPCSFFFGKSLFFLALAIPLIPPASFPGAFFLRPGPLATEKMD